MTTSSPVGALPKQAWWALGLALLLGLPSLWVGLQLDDYFHWGLVNDRSDVLRTHSPASLFGLFSFLDGDLDRVRQLMDMGLVPWWTNPHVEYAFWRPLTEITHSIDYGFWPQIPELMHAHSLLYFGLMLWLGFRLFRVLQGDSAAWLWAVFIFALSYSHGVPAGWLANRNSVLAVLFMTLALLAHHQWRCDGNGFAAVRANVFFALALLCGEVAVSTGAYLFSYALLYERGEMKRRAVSLVPYIVIGVAWLLVRAGMGYGASGSGHYLDPLQTPGLFLQALASRGLDLMGGLFWVIPPELGSALPSGRWWVFLLLTMLLMAVAWPVLKHDRRARFWLLGALLCLVPVASTVPHSRLLIAASLGAAGFLGLVFAAWRRGELAQGRLAKTVVSCLLGVLVFLQLGLSALLLPVEMVSMRLAGDSLVNQGARNWDLASIPTGATPILINPPLSSAGGYINGVRDYEGLPVTNNTWLLASGTRELQLRTLDEYSFDIQSSQGLYDASQEEVLRGPQAPFEVGERVALSGMTVTIMMVDGGVPTLAHFQFDQPLASGAYYFSHWNSGNVAQCQLPAIGQSIQLKLTSKQCQ